MPTWSAEELTAVLNDLAALTPIRITWDLTEGYEWASIYSGSDLCAIVRAPMTVNRARRFVFVQRGCSISDLLKTTFASSKCQVVELDDFEAPILSVRRSDLSEFMQRPLPPPHEFDPERFAANDLAFFTA
jgi:hypothetical protein